MNAVFIDDYYICFESWNEAITRSGITFSLMTFPEI